MGIFRKPILMTIPLLFNVWIGKQLR